MTWTAHITEQIVFKHHLPELSITWLIIGAMFPDLFLLDKIYLYFFKHPDVPAMTLHRMAPYGMLHTLFFPFLVSIIIAYFDRLLGLGFLIGAWSHVFSDCFDSVGCMIFYPFSDKLISLNLWEYGVDAGIIGDAKLL